MKIEPSSWVLVTGASSGIGRSFACELAARGCHLILVARDVDRLHDLAGSLATEHRVQVEVCPTDLGVASEVRSLIERVEELGVPVDLLVNNAAFGTYGLFGALPGEGEIAQVRVNVEAVVALTHALLQPMLERGRGGIIQVASVVGFGPLPYMTTYAATKAFVIAFAEGLWQECRGHGVHVMLFAPGGTTTEFHQRAGVRKSRPKFTQDPPEKVARMALDGFEKGRRVVFPGGKNWLTALGTRFAPRRLLLWAVGKAMRPKE